MVALAEIAASPTPRVPAPSCPLTPTIAALALEDAEPHVGRLSQAIGACNGKQGGVRIGGYVDEVVAYRQMVGGVVGTYYPHYNHLYSVAALTNAAGQVVERYSYDAYGKQKITSATGAVRTKSAVGFDRGFTGYITDNETGLLHARARQYSPTLGRFVGRDPYMKTRDYALYVNDIRVAEVKHDRAARDMEIAFDAGAEDLVDVLDAYKAAKDNLRAKMERDFAQLRLVFTPSSYDGYQDGSSLYGAYFVPNMLDPSGEDFIKDYMDCVREYCPPPCPRRGISGKKLLRIACTTFCFGYAAAKNAIPLPGGGPFAPKQPMPFDPFRPQAPHDFVTPTGPFDPFDPNTTPIGK